MEQTAKRVRLSSEIREKLVRRYVDSYLAKEGKLPTRRDVGQAIGGYIETILKVLREYRGNVNKK